MFAIRNKKWKDVYVPDAFARSALLINFSLLQLRNVFKFVPRVCLIKPSISLMSDMFLENAVLRPP